MPTGVYKRSESHIAKLKGINKGRKLSLATKNKIGIANTGRIRTPDAVEKWRKSGGDKWSEERREKHSIAQRGDKSCHWKGGKSNRHIIHTFIYKQWRMRVFTRDNFTCQFCGKRGYITAHHIKSWAKYHELRYVVDNGITLCEDCHKLTDNYKGRGNKKE